MIHVIASAIKERLEELTWPDRVAGLAVPVTKYSAENTPEFVFPITNDTLAQECIQRGKYWDLVPNNSYKGSLYVEQTGPLRFDGFEKKYTLMNFSANMRVVGWLNLAKMGYQDASMSGLFSMSVIAKLLESRGVVTVSNLQYSGALVYVEIVGEAEKNAGIFSRYSYSRFSNFLIYPFDYFAIDINVRFVVSSACVQAVEVGSELCEDNGIVKSGPPAV